MTPAVLILTGTCGSGKTTVSRALGMLGWTHLSEDTVWMELFGRDRGAFGSGEHRAKRASVHGAIFRSIIEALRMGDHVVIDATVHEAPPEGYQEYSTFFAEHGINWALRILHPQQHVAVQRASSRSGWRADPERVAALHAKFTKTTFPAEWFLDTSCETIEESVAHVQSSFVG